ncbi:MAG TPA: ABC transporter ATP-binding protein [Bryobacteraceae bacterium]|nr:ABC transporter ATP-binding protein [Bryobacteraceae bacterium]
MIDSFAIETRGLTRRFGSRTAVDSIELCVPRGVIYGFLGPNGAGKTTTIRLLLGLLHADCGSILLNGQFLTKERREVLRDIGALVETPSLYPHLTGQENLEVTRRILNLPRSRIADTLALFGLTADAHRPVRNYSLGMRQRLGLALAWLGHPGLMILDEPANGLDPSGMRELRDHLRQLAHERHVTVFLSSHVLNEVEQIADWIGIIHHGRLLFQGRLEELQRYQSPLKLATDRSSNAAAVLEAQGWRVLENFDGAVTVEVPSDTDAALINRCLLEHGIPVYRLERRPESLEELFLRLVSSGGPGGTQ